MSHGDGGDGGDGGAAGADTGVGAGAVSGSAESSTSTRPGIEPSFASSSESVISMRLMRSETSESFVSQQFEKLFRKMPVFVMKLFTSRSVFCIGIGGM